MFPNQKSIGMKIYNCSIRFYLGIIAVILLISACKKEKVEEIKYPVLKITNSINDDGRFITSVKLVGYEFSNLNITKGNSQSFVLDKGMPANLNNINVIATYKTTATPANSVNTNGNFIIGDTSRFVFKGCVTFGGCPGFSLEYVP